MKIVDKNSLLSGWSQKHIEELLINLIKRYTKVGDSVLDPFCGTGSIPLIAESLNRRGYCCDISPRYEEMARKRGVKRVHRCNASDLHQYPDKSINIIITSPPTIEYKEKYDINEPDIKTVIKGFIKEAKRILKGDRIIIIGVKEDALQYHKLCKDIGLKLTFVSLPISKEYVEAKG